MSIPPGTHLGRYEIRSQIGAGGMGEVYLAEDVRLNRRVALKILPETLAADEERMRRFVQEAQSASALNHPNILTIHEIGFEHETHFIATEYVEGETLRNRLQSEPVPLKSALDVAVQIASALQAAHGAGIVHRDIKPENVMIRPDGLVKLLDFGIAKLTEKRSESVNGEAATAIKAETSPGLVIGTAAYMSPEQARGQVVDARSDIFSFGVVLYEMIAGKRPFTGANAIDVIGSILNKEPKPVHQQVAEVPHEIERIIGKTLRKDRDERYQTVKDLLLDLKDVKQELEFQNKLERTASPPHIEEAKTQIINAIATDATVATGAPPSTSSTERAVSGIKQHRRGFTIGASVLLIAAIALGFWLYNNRSSLNAVPIESIAVLPFINESGNADVEYLSDGMTESLITNLSQLPKLNIKARSSVFRYKGRGTDAKTVGRELNVQTILNGRVVQRGQDLTLHVELIDAATENVLWKADYNRQMTNLVSLQSEIARDVADRLRVKLSGTDERKLANNYTENAEAYQLYLQGLYHWNKLSPPEIRKSLEYFQQAVDVDPNYALAYADVGRVYFSLAMTADTTSQEVLPKAREAALKALKIDDTLAQAHTTLGWVKFWFDWDWDGAEQEFQRSLSLNPNVGDTYIAYAHVFTFTGRVTEALPLARRARELDPLNLRINALEGQALFYAGKYDDAIVRLQKTIELEPNFFLAHLFLARVYIEKKMYTEAIAEATKARDVSGGHSEAVAHIVYTLAKSGRREEAQAALNELKKRAAEERYVPPYSLALAYNGLGETDEAIASLEKGLQQRDVRMTLLKVEPKWNNLRGDPRFQDLLRRVGFPS